MNLEELKLSEEAFHWVCNNKIVLLNTFANPEICEQDVKLISLFMAGSPGAGKTEVSRRLVENFDKKPVIIDADEIRKICPGYKGENADIYQKAANKGVNLLYDFVLDKDLNVILDGTFAYGDCTKNI
jgi:UDP-N-acetylglucosamine kinase